MKKGLAGLTSVVAAAGMTMILGADAANNKYYEWSMPYFYMKALETEDYEVLRDGAVYIDRSAEGGDEDITLDMEIFIKDERKLTHTIYCKVMSRTEDLQLVSMEGPVAKYGCSPYKKVTSDKAIDGWCNKNMIGFTYHDLCFDLIAPPWETTGENSDDYPLACFKAVLKKEAVNGSYMIDYPKYGEYNSNVEIGVTDPIGRLSLMSTYFQPAYYSPTLYIHASNRALGDVNGDGTINETDAECAMKMYINPNNSSLCPTEAEELAADVNGDERVDDEDVALILEYCAKYKNRTPDMTINEYVRSR